MSTIMSEYVRHMKYILILIFLHPITVLGEINQTFSLGGNVQIELQSNGPIPLSNRDILNLSGHLPGLELTKLTTDVGIYHQQSEKNDFIFTDSGDSIHLQQYWGKGLHDDIPHLLYGLARKQWLSDYIFPVHAVCIGTAQDGYVLLMGAPGSGKTSVLLESITNTNIKVFSGDKTLIRVSNDNELVAISGTKLITIRKPDVSTWENIKKQSPHYFGDRYVFRLPNDIYSESESVKIKKIFIIGMNNGDLKRYKIDFPSSLHTLFPFFMDKQREDTIIADGKAIYNGQVSNKIKQKLTFELSESLQLIPTEMVLGTRADIATVIKNELKPKKKTILLGVCGIGNGHRNRQLPLIKYLLSKNYQVTIFSYGKAYDYFIEMQKNHINFSVFKVANPYIIGTKNGLDFKTSATIQTNQQDFNRINNLAMNNVLTQNGTPDLVISDYESVSAQLAYAKNIPFVTFDQQSKYFAGVFPKELHGTSYIDEVERLRMFFPKAIKRLAVSFFNVERNVLQNDEQVTILPSIIRDDLVSLKNKKIAETNSILFYVTSQNVNDFPLELWLKTLESIPGSTVFHVFLPKDVRNLNIYKNIKLYTHGDEKFNTVLGQSSGIITTAGHNLISEAMYLEKPVYALPLDLYEQQMNAHIIDKYQFGVSEETITKDKIMLFLRNINQYKKNIVADSSILVRGVGNDEVIKEIEELL